MKPKLYTRVKAREQVYLLC